jgi:Putative abortive phage resistance protein AbiGi, antitoxin
MSQRYISNELVHFVGRGMEQAKQFDLLKTIISEKWITHPPHNPSISGNLTITSNKRFSQNEMYAPEITCFADIPIDDLQIHMTKFSSIGLSFSKSFIASQGGCPVHYIPTNSAAKIPDTDVPFVKGNGYKGITNGNYFDSMIEKYHSLLDIMRKLASDADNQPGVSPLVKEIMDLQFFLNFHIFSFLKFFDSDKRENDPDNYYFEREWRIVGNLNFTIKDIITVFFPKKFLESFQSQFPEYEGKYSFTPEV